jgi:hypothetical protein
MQDLTGIVGQGGTNAVHDAALVQAILFACRRPPLLDPTQSRYITTIDGDFGKGSKDALSLFQSERVFVTPDGLASTPVQNATMGQVRTGDATWQAMQRLMDPAFRPLRILPGSKVPYLEASTETRDEAIMQAESENFTATFKPRVTALIRQMYALHGIILRVCPQGGRRTFQEQYNLLVGPGNVTNAGPGESNHNFGQATDIGFKGLRWIRPNGTIEEHETPWLHKLEAQPGGGGKALVFWNKQREVGTTDPILLFRGPESDRPHLQAWNDAVVNMRRSLAGLLTSVSGMRWRAQAGYQTDFGLGGNTYYAVGTAAQIWSRTGPIPLPALQANGFDGPAIAAGTTTLRDRLRAAFEAAETNWTSWQPM